MIFTFNIQNFSAVMSAYLAGARLAITGERHRPSAVEALNRAATPNLSINITISNYQRSINIANCISGIRILSKLASELTREGYITLIKLVSDIVREWDTLLQFCCFSLLLPRRDN